MAQLAAAPTTAPSSDALIHFYAPILRVNESDRTVEGYAFTAEVVDGEGGVRLKRKAMIAATPDYMRYGALRVMHQANAAGRTQHVKWDENGAYIKAKIVDDNEWKKCQGEPHERVYNGFSVGVRPSVMLGKDVDSCVWVETSLVDRPKDPGAIFTVVRVDGMPEPEAAPEIEAAEGDAPVPPAGDTPLVRDADAAPASGITSTTPNLPVRENLEGKIPAVRHYSCGKATCCGHRTAAEASACAGLAGEQRSDTAFAPHYVCGAATCHDHATPTAALECMGKRGADGRLIRFLEALVDVEPSVVEPSVVEPSTAEPVEERAAEPVVEAPTDPPSIEIPLTRETLGEALREELRALGLLSGSAWGQTPSPTGPQSPPVVVGEHDSTPAGDHHEPVGQAGYADPGYQADAVARFPLKANGMFDAGRVEEAWTAMHDDATRENYTLAQITSIMGAILAAAQMLGITLPQYPSDDRGRPLYPPGKGGHAGRADRLEEAPPGIVPDLTADLAAIDAAPDPLARRSLILAAMRNHDMEGTASTELIQRLESANTELTTQVTNLTSQLETEKTARTQDKDVFEARLKKLEDQPLQRSADSPPPVANPDLYAAQRVFTAAQHPTDAGDQVETSALQQRYAQLVTPPTEVLDMEMRDSGQLRQLRASQLNEVKTALAARGVAV